MKKKECLAFFREKFGKEISGGSGEWKFLVKKEGEYGFFKLGVRLLKSTPIQYLDLWVDIGPSWYAEVIKEIREDDILNSLMSFNHMQRPEGGEVLEANLLLGLEAAYKLYEEKNKPETISQYLSKVYEYGLSNDSYQYNSDFYYCCVFKGNVEYLEEERVAKENGTSIQPPVYTLQFFTNAVRLAKEFRSGERVCPIDF